MTLEQAELVLAAVAAGDFTAREGSSRLVAGGYSPQDAQDMVFTALGGSDLVEVGDDGRERYVPSGKLVREVNEAMRR